MLRTADGNAVSTRRKLLIALGGTLTMWPFAVAANLVGFPPSVFETRPFFAQ